ncbi:hypothetical protein CKJ85_08440 [Corynebacterium sp. NML 150383]|nr:hypothetical protein CKJ85_08440 [Corynebacterium sp. NML 150383]
MGTSIGGSSVGVGSVVVATGDGTEVSGAAVSDGSGATVGSGSADGSGSAEVAVDSVVSGTKVSEGSGSTDGSGSAEVSADGSAETEVSSAGCDASLVIGCPPISRSCGCVCSRICTSSFCGVKPSLPRFVPFFISAPLQECASPMAWPISWAIVITMLAWWTFAGLAYND